MISVFLGDDTFAIEKSVDDIVKSFSGTAESISGSELQVGDLPDLLMGVSLFSEKRLILLKDASSNSLVFEKIAEWIDKISDDIHLILIENKIDKRSKIYKLLKQKANLREFYAWTERDGGQARSWLADQANQEGLKIGAGEIDYLIQRVGLDKWRLHQSLQKLLLSQENISKDLIDDVIAPTISENVFNLLELALQNNTGKLNSMMRNMELQEDPYAIFGLISSQVFQLLALARSGSSDAPEKDFAIHPFVSSKLKQHARKLGLGRVEAIAKATATADKELKTSSVDPWIILQRLLIGIAA